MFSANPQLASVLLTSSMKWEWKPSPDLSSWTAVHSEMIPAKPWDSKSLQRAHRWMWATGAWGQLGDSKSRDYSWILSLGIIFLIRKLPWSGSNWGFVSYQVWAKLLKNPYSPFYSYLNIETEREGFFFFFLILRQSKSKSLKEIESEISRVWVKKYLWIAGRKWT